MNTRRLLPREIKITAYKTNFLVTLSSVVITVIMKAFIALCFLGLTTAFPFNGGVKPKFGNPEEWGPYFEGDIKFKNPNQRNAIADESFRWPDAKVIYVYDTDITESDISTIQQVMQDFNNLTGGCVTFKERTNEVDYVLFTSDENDGCFSYVGRIGGQQQLNYPQWCINQYGSVQHEMLHALGFYHEQNSPDRDDYVTIQWENVIPGAAGGLRKCSYDDCTTLDAVYDYSSVLHSSGYIYSKNGELTIVTNDPSKQSLLGQSVGVSEGDINQLMLMYNC